MKRAIKELREIKKMERKYYLNYEETDLKSIMAHLQDLLENNGNTEMWEQFGISFKDVETLEIVNYCDIPYNYFNGWLTEALDYQCNIVFDKCEVKEDTADYKKIKKMNDVEIKFDADSSDKDFPIAVYSRTKKSKEWEYVDNITENSYKMRYRKDI